MQLVRLVFGCFLMGLSSLSVNAGRVSIQEGVHYQRVPHVHENPSSDRVEVMAFFSYACPHCYQFDQILHEWAKKSSFPVDLVLVPVTFRPGWDIYAAAYYTAELFNKLDGIHADFYKAIHEEGRNLMDMGELTQFFAKHGITPSQFMKTIDSFGVRVKMGSAVKMATDYRISAVPTLLVNRKYLTNVSTTGKFEGLLTVLEYLIQKEVKKVKRPLGK